MRLLDNFLQRRAAAPIVLSADVLHSSTSGVRFRGEDALMDVQTQECLNYAPRSRTRHRFLGDLLEELPTPCRANPFQHLNGAREEPLRGNGRLLFIGLASRAEPAFENRNCSLRIGDQPADRSVVVGRLSIFENPQPDAFDQAVCQVWRKSGSRPNNCLNIYQINVIIIE